MDAVTGWVRDHWEGFILALGGTFVWMVKRGAKETLSLHQQLRTDHGRIGALEEELAERETLCRRHHEALQEIRDATNTSTERIMEAIHGLSQRVAKLEGIDKGRHARRDTESG